jgi:hypothetical protein
VVRLAHAQLRGTGLMVNSLRLSRALAESTSSTRSRGRGPEASLVACPRSLCAPAVIRMHGGHHFFRRRSAASRRSALIEKKPFRCDASLRGEPFRGVDALQLLQLTHRSVESFPTRGHRDVCADPADEEEALIVFAGTATERRVSAS